MAEIPKGVRKLWETLINVFWDIPLCNLVEVYRRFRGAYCLRDRPENGYSTYLWNVDLSTRKHGAVSWNLHTRRRKNV